MGILEILSGQQKLDAMTGLPVEEDVCYFSGYSIRKTMFEAVLRTHFF